jgi:uncharacterized protein (TIGR03067 family)
VSPLFLSLALTVAAPGPKDSPSIAGVWVGETAVFDGATLPAPNGGIVFRFGRDGTLTTTEGKGEPADAGKYSTDPTKSPAEVDIAPPPGLNESVTLGIYQLAGDRLTLCFVRRSGEGQAERPTRFESPEGSGAYLLTFKRAPKKKE